MGLYKRDKIWWMKGTVRGRPVYESTGTKNKKLAEKIYAKWKYDLEEGRWFPQDAEQNILMGDIIDKYMKEVSP
jgi:hypothetical protein